MDVGTKPGGDGREVSKFIASCGVALSVFFCVISAWFIWKGYSFSLHGFPHLSIPPNASSAERAGLRLTITSARRREDLLRVSYALEWIPMSDSKLKMHFIRPFGHLRVLFWDRNDREIDPDHGQARRGDSCFSAPYSLGGFVSPEQTHIYLVQDEFSVVPPFGSTFVAIRLFDGLTTQKVRIASDE